MTVTTFLTRKSGASLLAIGVTLAMGLVPTVAADAARARPNRAPPPVFRPIPAHVTVAADAASARPKRAKPPVVSVMPANITVAGGVVLSIGSSKVVNLSGRMSDVVVANPAVADVFVRSETQIYILGKAPGETAISAISKDGRTLYSTIVRVGNNLTSIDQMLKMAMPEANMQVATMNGMVLLTGTIKAPEDAAEAERLTQTFVGKEVTVVSRLRTATPIQVNLQVRISEVSRSLTHRIGMNLTGLGSGQGSFTGYVGRNTRSFGTFEDYAGGFNDPNISRPFTFQQPTDASTTLGFVAKLFGMDVAGALDLAESTGLSTTLAQPNLTSLSGETASFLAGGEYPYQVSNGVQGNTIEFKQYGVQLAFTPTVLADGRISLRVRPTVSSLDFTINSAVPALKSRTVETTVELGSGQAFMIAGLLSNESGNTIDKVPGIGNVPILGSLFKSRRFQRDETELVIVVTPYLVKPVNAGDIRLPTDGFRNATEGQGLLLQQGSDGISGARDPGPTIAPASPSQSVRPSQGANAASGARAPAQSARLPAPSKSGPGAAAPGFSF